MIWGQLVNNNASKENALSLLLYISPKDIEMGTNFMHLINYWYESLALCNGLYLEHVLPMSGACTSMVDVCWSTSYLVFVYCFQMRSLVFLFKLVYVYHFKLFISCYVNLVFDYCGRPCSGLLLSFYVVRALVKTFTLTIITHFLIFLSYIVIKRYISVSNHFNEILN